MFTSMVASAGRLVGWPHFPIGPVLCPGTVQGGAHRPQQAR